jgi:hypothetical protein
MTGLADDFEARSVSGPSGDIAPDLAGLAERMRSTVTPVVGYLELISQDTGGVSPERRLDWIATIERRLDAVRDASDRISKACDALRNAINDPASGPRAPQARGD